MKGLSAAGGMMRYVGFAILIKVMVSRDLWGFFFCAFALAAVMASIASISGAALILLAFIGFALAFWDFQIQTRLKSAESTNGGFEDGI
jgi:PTS system N-acetylgalactosamine-specific IIC component